MEKITENTEWKRKRGYKEPYINNDEYFLVVYLARNYRTYGYFINDKKTQEQFKGPADFKTMDEAKADLIKNFNERYAQ